MGDYGFGVLVQNNTGNKSAFPVRIHPHLQAPHHHQNASQSPAYINSTTTAGNGTSSGGGGSPWLFPATSGHSSMQDELLGPEKVKGQPQEMQEEKQQSPGSHQETGLISELEKARGAGAGEEGKVDGSPLDSGSGKEKLRLELPVRSEERREGKECRSRWAPDH